MDNLDAIYSREQARMKKYVKQFEGDVEKVMALAQKLTLAKIANVRPQDALQYEFVWRQTLKEAGYYKLVDGLIDGEFNKMYDGTIKAFEAGGMTTAFTSEDATKIQTLKNMKRQFFYRLADDVGMVVKKEVYKYAISDASLATMTAGIANTLEGTKLAKYAKTYARTAIQEFQQEVIDVRAKDISAGVWIYVGVRDDLNRDFCAELLDEAAVYSEEEKGVLESSPEREYNCRHRFYFMAEKEARELGYST